MHDRSFFGKLNPAELLERFGSPLYVYNEAILRQRAREMAQLVQYRPFKAHLSVKANTNLTLMAIARQEGMEGDAMSPGEIFLLEKAGYTPEEIFFIPNNVSDEELRYAVNHGVLVSLDSLSQLERFGRLFPGQKVAVRFNTGHGVGHNDKVITAGEHTKFGIDESRAEEVEAILKKYELTMAGINQHVGRHFLASTEFIAGCKSLLALAMRFPHLEFIDLGGGFGIPYLWRQGEERLDLAELGRKLDALMEDFARAYGRRICFKTEPGRYPVAECGALLGTVYALKDHAGTHYVGTDVGFNTLQRVLLYDAYHELDFYRNDQRLSGNEKLTTVVGNICESGDKLCEKRPLPPAMEGDVLCLWDAGAYGYSMASNYNQRLRPAEVLIEESGHPRLIRRRDTLEGLMAGFENL